MAWGPQPQQIGNAALIRAVASGKARIIVLGPTPNYYFQAPKDGLYTFVLSGSSGAGWINTSGQGAASGGGGHGYSEATVKMKKGEYTGQIKVGSGGYFVGGRGLGYASIPGENSFVSLSGFALGVTAGGNALGPQAPGDGGVGSGGSLNLSGGAGGLSVANTYGNYGANGQGSNPGYGGYPSTNPSNNLVPSGGGGGAGTDLQPGLSGGIGVYWSQPIRAPGGGGGGHIIDPGSTPGYNSLPFSSSIGGDGRLSIFWMGDA